MPSPHITSLLVFLVVLSSLPVPSTSTSTPVPSPSVTSSSDAGSTSNSQQNTQSATASGAAINSTSTTTGSSASATPSTPSTIAATTTTPSPTFVPATGNGPEVEINITITTHCNATTENRGSAAHEALKNNLTKTLIVAYNNSKLKAASVNSFTCKDNNTKVEAILNVTFGKGISAVVSLKALLVSHLSSVNIRATVEVIFKGITIKSKPKGDECQKKCCDGAGGTMTVERVCSPADKCEGRDKDPDKTEDGHCDTGGLCQTEDEKCDGSSSSPSLVVIVLLAFATFVGAMI